MNVISFSLYGTDKKYINGALENIKLAKKFYPNWKCFFYISNSIDNEVREYLSNEGGLIYSIEGSETNIAMFWRFFPARDDRIKILLSRDCDSRLGEREAMAVRDWLNSGKSFHIMRDHPCHNTPILGGMWGATGKGLEPIRKMLEKSISDNNYGIDQKYLAKYVYPYIKYDSCIHDSFFSYEWHSKPFPTKRVDSEFVGEIYDEFNQPYLEHRDILNKCEKSILAKTMFKIKSLQDIIKNINYWR